MGSGTVIALARAQGHVPIGVDIDPLAILLARVWTTSLDVNAIRRRAKAVLASAHHMSSGMKLRDAYPAGADSETRQFTRYWFDAGGRKQLAALSAAIRRTRNSLVRDALWCSFSRLIITKQAGASLAMDLAHSRPHKTYGTAPLRPFDKFMEAVEYVLNNCIAVTDRKRGYNPKLVLGDARYLDLPKESIDLVLTSPPYLNAIDYMRCSKFSLIWMGHSIGELRAIRGISVGTEAGGRPENDSCAERLMKALRIHSRLTPRDRGVLRRFIEDMELALGEAARVLVPGGRAIYVIGENTVGGVYIRNARIIQHIAMNVGLELDFRSSRALPANRRYLPPPTRPNRSATLDARMRREVILSFSKPRQGPAKLAAVRA